MKQSRVICITGGIGSGKSTVCAMLESKGHPVYYSDERAKALMHTNATLVQGITALLGEQAYLHGELNRAYVAEKIFGSSALKEKLESLVHPVVREDFEHWKLNSGSTVVFKESALVLETGDPTCEHVVSIVADEHVRIARVMARNTEMNESQIRARLANQLGDAQRRAQSDTIIENNGSLEDLNLQVDYLLSKVI
ncbi:MAG: dephospho-CoA kinase [Bacteroidetes bacterium]|nr:MAG: dephospho-CoA kinase [Bacteroidota bacterium]REK64706.1 MAG: dephospho-CoA kinase [Bacteroidota bacterium]